MTDQRSKGIVATTENINENGWTPLNGWMDENGVELWFKKGWVHRPGGVLKKSSTLMWDPV